jgi:nicotinamide-nucleotide amidase
MTVEILNIGTEILLGEVVNTHAGWIAKRIFPLGLRVARQTTVPDGPEIRRAVIEAWGRADVVIVTGGLGPTTDDITREVVAELLGRRLRVDQAVECAIRERLEVRGFEFLERMARQAMVPEGAEVLQNPNGTAPGLYLPAVELPSTATPHLFLLPGPPRELQPMFLDHVLPALEKLCAGISRQISRTYRVVGMGESAVEKLIGLELNAHPQLEVGYCARSNEVDFRLIGPIAVLDEIEPLVLERLGKHLVSMDGSELEEQVVRLLSEVDATVATAESCTGGLLASRITDVPGASGVFMRGFVTYSNESKSEMLGVDPGVLAAHGAVSEPVALAMAEGAQRKAAATYGVGITGIAGPGGGSPEKPVGLVFIAVVGQNGKSVCAKALYPSDRSTFKRLASQRALDMLRLELLSKRE